MSERPVRRIAEPEDYALIFDSHKIGQKIFNDLVARFGLAGGRGDGIDRILNTFENQGARKVIEFITLRINQANGVKDHDNTE